jgi:hypothetical protein
VIVIVIIEAVRRFPVKAVKVLLKAVRMLEEAVEVLVKAVRVIVGIGREMLC